MARRFELTSPLFTGWTPQYVKLGVAGATVGEPLALFMDGVEQPFQYTGAQRDGGAEVALVLGFEQGQTRRLEFLPAATASTNLTRQDQPWPDGLAIGQPGCQLMLPAPTPGERVVAGPFGGFAGRPMHSTVTCETPLEEATLARLGDGPLWTDYEVTYRFTGRRVYTVHLRCYRNEPWIEVSERCGLGMYGALSWTINPAGAFNAILRGDSFEGESQPKLHALGEERPNDVLCRLQMPVLSEYFIPNNHGWFAFCHRQRPGAGMVGILGLYGAKWLRPVENVVELLDRQGTVEWQASLVGGARHWLLYAGPLETVYTPEQRLVFHRLHAEFNGLRLDEHLDLTGKTIWDDSCWQEPGLFIDADVHAAARRRTDELPCLRNLAADPHPNSRFHRLSYDYLLDPTPVRRDALYNHLAGRFERWVRQFQGWRDGTNDYQKNVIGFSRYLRGLLIGYELLRRDKALTPEQLGKLNAWFAFAARRILDEGRWPHSRTTLHPDHPESMRDIYTYGGEHKPDRLYWTNSLPNFQGDPLCALAHLSAIFKDHPDAPAWQRFALDDLEGQLDAYCGDSGAWEESINYTLYTLSYWLITFRAVKYRLGIDYFEDLRVRRLVGWLCRFFGPLDRRFGQYTWPGIGNSHLPTLAGHYLLAYAAELADGDPLRHACIAVYQVQEDAVELHEHYPTVMAAMGFAPDRRYRLLRNVSELMDEVGVAMRHAPGTPAESYLFQKIGFAKDHYEGDESAFNWYAKGVPLAMDYGTYTGDISPERAHNLVEIPDEDNLRRGYLAGHLFSAAVDYTHCELPVTMKLLWGRVRDFAEVDGQDGKVNREKTPYFYIGDDNPIGPRTWKVRLLLFGKPDYLVLFDRVYGDVPHRWNLHLTADALARDGAYLQGTGRFELDPLVFVQHPAAFDLETGEIVPKHPNGEAHRQQFFRVYNRGDGIYRTVLFARERGRDVRLEALGEHGVRIVTPDYTDLVWLHNDIVRHAAHGLEFYGRAGWIRQTADGKVQAAMADGDVIEAFGVRLAGRGPWTYNLAGHGEIELSGGPPRQVSIATRAGHPPTAT